MATLKQLKKKQSLVLTHLKFITDQLEELRLKNELPALRKKYEGKTFVFFNSHGGEPRWKLYYRVISVESLRYVIASSFQIEPDDEGNPIEVEFTMEKWLSFGMLETECPLKEYESERLRALRFAEEMSLRKK